MFVCKFDFISEIQNSVFSMMFYELFFSFQKMLTEEIDVKNPEIESLLRNLFEKPILERIYRTKLIGNDKQTADQKFKTTISELETILARDNCLLIKKSENGIYSFYVQGQDLIEPYSIEVFAYLEHLEVKSPKINLNGYRFCFYTRTDQDIHQKIGNFVSTID